MYRGRDRDGPATLSQAAQPDESGFQMRITPNLPHVLLISDQKAALIPLGPPRTSQGALYIREPEIVAVLAVVFGTVWDAATPPGSSTPEDGTQVVSAHEQAPLKYLAASLTDEAAAQRLGISVRTARQQVACLMSKLGASSRFQAGHEATRRGWLGSATMSADGPVPIPGAAATLLQDAHGDHRIAAWLEPAEDLEKVGLG